MTPDKRATLLKAFLWTLATIALIGGWITAPVWLAALGLQ